MRYTISDGLIARSTEQQMFFFCLAAWLPIIGLVAKQKEKFVLVLRCRNNFTESRGFEFIVTTLYSLFFTSMRCSIHCPSGLHIFLLSSYSETDKATS